MRHQKNKCPKLNLLLRRLFRALRLNRGDWDHTANSLKPMRKSPDDNYWNVANQNARSSRMPASKPLFSAGAHTADRTTCSNFIDSPGIMFLQRLPSSSKPESGWFLIAQMCNISPLTCPSTDGPNHPSKQQQPSCSCTPESFCQSPTDKVRMNEICAQLCCKEPSPPSKIRS